jgi:hypothetical protein
MFIYAQYLIISCSCWKASVHLIFLITYSQHSENTVQLNPCTLLYKRKWDQYNIFLQPLTFAGRTPIHLKDLNCLPHPTQPEILLYFLSFILSYFKGNSNIHVMYRCALTFSKTENYGSKEDNTYRKYSYMTSLQKFWSHIFYYTQ